MVIMIVRMMMLVGRHPPTGFGSGFPPPLSLKFFTFTFFLFHFSGDDFLLCFVTNIILILFVVFGCLPQQSFSKKVRWTFSKKKKKPERKKKDKGKERTEGLRQNAGLPTSAGILKSTERTYKKKTAGGATDESRHLLSLSLSLSHYYLFYLFTKKKISVCSAGLQECSDLKV